MIKTLLLKPFQKFIQLQASGSILLLLGTLLALFWANSPWSATYHALWQTPFSAGPDAFPFNQSWHFWINDGLMTLFFFLVGLEIKRELLEGELSTPKQASLPILGALGGMLAPALIYLLFNPPGSAWHSGWGIPTVTDIAFAVGVLAILGDKVPLGLKVFLVALAIVDDIGAILIIALFYSQGIQPVFLLISGLLIGLLVVLNQAGVKKPWPYAILGIFLWLAVLNSGVHATIAGVLLAFTIPSQAKIQPGAFQSDVFQAVPPSGLLQQMEQAIHPWVTYGILPLFALANAGVNLNLTHLASAFTSPVTSGILVSLLVGKPLGITLFAWLAVRCKLAELPAQVRWSQLHAVSMLGGIGFTMSIFITLLAFQNPNEITDAKLGILMGSLLSGGLGILWLNHQLKPNSQTTL